MGGVPTGGSAVYAIVLAALLVLSTVAPVVASGSAASGIDDGDLVNTSTTDGLLSTDTPTETESNTGTATETATATATESDSLLGGAVETVKDTVTETTKTVENETEATAGTVEDGVNETSDSVEGTVNDTMDAVHETSDAVEDEVESTTDDTTDAVDDTTDAVDDTTDTVENTTNSTAATVDEPLESVRSSGNVTVENASAGEPVIVDVSAADTGNVGVRTLNVTATKNASYTLNVTASDAKPADAPEFSRRDGGVDLGSIRVNHTISDENISNVTFTFSLSDERLADANATPEEVALYRHHDGEWSALNTTFLRAENGTYVFRAESPGLSDFTAASQKPEFELRRALVDPQELAVGETVDIRVRIHNAGDADGSYTAELLFNEEVVGTKQVTIAADGTRQVSFARVPDEAGSYEVKINDETAGTLSVAAATTPATTVTESETPTAAEGGSDGPTIKSAPGFGPLVGLAGLAVYLLLRRP